MIMPNRLAPHHLTLVHDEPGSEAEVVLGVSAAMREVENLLRKIAGRAFPVLFTGETGTGKEICARFLHGISKRAAEPFIAVNCAAIPAELLESEVFGHERGAFSGAQQKHLGYAERARKGTLFLDEICEMPLALQSKLLRLLEERSFFRVGGHAPVSLQARIVCATNRDVAAAIGEGRLRQDLFFRINTVQVDLPPLRTRPEDIAWLLTACFAGMSDESASPLRGVGQPVIEAALRHTWPGNARELRNRMERAVALANGPFLTPTDLFPELRTATRPPEAGADARPVLPLSIVRDAAEKRHIEAALRECQGQIGAACRYLEVSRSTLWEKMRRHGLMGAGAPQVP